MNILGVDPGTARLGWGIVLDQNNQQTVGPYGCLKTKKSQSQPQRLALIFDNFAQLLKQQKPDVVAVEDIFFFKNQKTVIQVGQARGVVLLACQQHNLPVYSYTPLQIKLAVTGYGRADKNQVQQMTKTILKLNTIPKPDDTADALAIALTHAFSYKMKKRVK